MGEMSLEPSLLAPWPDSLLSGNLVSANIPDSHDQTPRLPVPNFKNPNLNPSGNTPSREMSSQGNSDVKITCSKITLENLLSCPLRLVLVLQPLLGMPFSTLKCENHPMRLKEGTEGKDTGSASGNQACLLSSHHHIVRDE